jgi:hypothetical protein
MYDIRLMYSNFARCNVEEPNQKKKKRTKKLEKPKSNHFILHKSCVNRKDRKEEKPKSSQTAVLAESQTWSKVTNPPRGTHS